jgi:TRAP transporter 4TM/12TM fusion protein
LKRFNDRRETRPAGVIVGILFVKPLTDAMAALFTGAALIWAADIPRLFGVTLFTEQYIAGMMALALPLVYLTVPARRVRITELSADEASGRPYNAPPWYDVLAAAIGFAAAAYVAIRFPALSDEVARRPWDGLIVAALMLVLFAEGLRRTSGMVITIVACTFFVLALVGHLLPTEISGRRVVLDRYVYFLLWDSSAVFGVPLKIITSIVVAFVFFGTVLFNTGGAAFFTDASMALMGRFRGGQAKISIMGSSLFGTISGSVVANVVTTGIVTIPMMKQGGFRARLAGAIEAVSSTGGQLLPPVMGVAAFLMAEFLQISYAEVALAALVPALLFYMALFIQADLEAARTGMRGMERALIPSASRVLKAGWFFPIPFVILIYALFWLNYQPETAALLATASVLLTALIFGFKGERPGYADLFGMLRDTGYKVLDLFMIGAAAGLVIATLNYTGLGFGLTLALVKLSGGNLFALLFIAAVACLILGMGMPTTGVYILLATLIAPALIEMGITPIAAHLFILYFGCLSMITPPVAIGAFAAANLARADPMATAFEAVRFGWAVFVIPFLFVLSNTLLLQGETHFIVLDIVAAAIGVWFGAAGIMGYSLRPLGLASRILYAAAGLTLLLPVHAIAGGRWINLAGALAAAVLIVRDYLALRKTQQSPER